MNETDNTAERRRLSQMLEALVKVAERASMTGALSDGGEEAVAMYNRILAYPPVQSGIDPFLFAPLPADASFDRVGVAAKLLAGFLYDDPKKPVSTPPFINIIGGASGVAGLNLDSIKDLGRVIRDELIANSGNIVVKINPDDPATVEVQPAHRQGEQE